MTVITGSSGSWGAKESAGAWGADHSPDNSCVDYASASYFATGEPTSIQISIGEPTEHIGYPFSLPAAIRVTISGGAGDDGYSATFVRGGEFFDVIDDPDVKGFFQMTYFAFDDEGASLQPIFNQHDGPNDTDPDQEITKPITGWLLGGGDMEGTYWICPAGGEDVFLRSSPVPMLASSGVVGVKGQYFNPGDGGPLMLEWEEVANPYA